MNIEPVIELSALASVERFLLLDVRDRTAFDAGHPPGAVRVPIELWEAAAKADETSLENVEYWETEIRKLGVTREVLAVVYDDGRMTEAARVWFILQYFGARASVLNGGWPVIAKGQLLPRVAAPSHAEEFMAQPGAGPVGLLVREQVKAQLNSQARIFDARSAAEYAGEDLRRNQRGGHLPGARHLAHTSLLESGRLLSPEQLNRLLNDAGFRPGDHIITHCDGGGRAALAAVAAISAGFSNVKAYYLSFADWARDDSCPVVRRLPRG
ncbi:MAG TPA: rhodanese-like domain-containing protein [Burkholderiales bacterium]|nr:rhodanese-like domain-containing protein [Burkholderiales bacterium]